MLPVLGEEAPGISSPPDARDLESARLSREAAYIHDLAFTLLTTKELLDPTGRRVPIDSLRAHLEERQYDQDARIALVSIADRTRLPEKRIAEIAAIFRAYGASRLDMVITPGPVDFSRGLFFNKPMTAEALQAMQGRPAGLRPGLPSKGVPYIPASDATVLAAARLVERSLLSEEPPTSPCFNTPFSLEPGVWALFRHHPGLGHSPDAVPFHKIGILNGKRANLPAMSIADADEIATAEKELRELVRKAGGGTVRALNTGELDLLWNLTRFDIVEPILILETKDPVHRLLLRFTRDHVQGIDLLPPPP